MSKYTVDEPPAGKKIDSALWSFKQMNGYPTDTYITPLSWDLNFEDVAERDGIGITVGYNEPLVLPYKVTKNGKQTTFSVNGGTRPLVKDCDDARLQRIVSRFEEWSDTPTAYFMYNYLQMHLRMRKDYDASQQ